MKKTLSRILVILLISIFIIEFTFANQAFALDAQETITAITNVMGGIISIVYWPKRIMVTGIAFIANIVTSTLATWSNDPGDKIAFITPFDIFFNKCKIMDVNFFDITGLATDSVVYKVRTHVAQWFYIMQLLAISILLVILIYVGIRMALSSVADEKARYKKMLFDWVCSLIILFIIPYIAIFTIQANNAIVAALENAITKDDIGGALGDIGFNAILGIGIDSITSVIVYVLIIFQIIGFVIAYLNRMLKVGFLLIISPLITITYSIDKMGDGKSQALNNWLKEFIYTILIQPFHCVVYITFIGVAMKLILNPSSAGLFTSEGVEAAKQYNQLANGILAVLCVKFIKDAEEIIRKIFNFKDNNKGTSLAAGLVASSVMLSKAKDVGKSARGLANKFASGNKYLSAASKNMGAIANKVKNSKAFDRIKNSKIGQGASAVGKGISKAAGKANQIKNKVSEKYRKFADNNKAIKGFKKGLKAGKKFWNSKPVKWMRGRNSLSSAIGIAAGLAAYASNDNGVLGAIGTGNAAYQSADAFLTSTAATIGSQNAEDIGQLNQGKQDQMAQNEREIKENEDRVKDLKNANEELSEELENENEEADELDSEISQKEEDIKASSDRMQDYKSAGAYDQEAMERASRSEMIQEVSDMKKRREELAKSIEGKTKELDKNDNTIAELQERNMILQQENKLLEAEIERTQSRLQSKEGIEGYINDIMENGASGKYKKDGDEYKSILARLQAILDTAGQSAKFDAFKSSMETELKANSKDFDLESTLKRCLGSNITSNKEYSRIFAEANNLRELELESQIYERTQFSMGMNVTQEKIAEQTGKNLWSE